VEEPGSFIRLGYRHFVTGRERLYCGSCISGLVGLIERQSAPGHKNYAGYGNNQEKSCGYASHEVTILLPTDTKNGERVGK
jgi:hypothetical protein